MSAMLDLARSRTSIKFNLAGQTRLSEDWELVVEIKTYVASCISIFIIEFHYDRENKDKL